MPFVLTISSNFVIHLRDSDFRPIGDPLTLCLRRTFLVVFDYPLDITCLTVGIGLNWTLRDGIIFMASVCSLYPLAGYATDWPAF